MIRLLLLIATFFPLTDIGKINAAKTAAKKAFLRGDYQVAAQQYQYLVDSLGVQEDEVLMNLAHARFQLNDSIPARQGYQQLTSSANSAIRSTAMQQLGVMSTRSGRLEEALEFFRSALKSNPSNEEARFNYELVKRKLEEQQKQQQQQKNNNNKKDKNQNQKNDQQKKDQQNQQQEQQKKNDQKKNQQQQSDKKEDQNKQDQQKKDSQQQKDQDQKKQQQDKLDPEKMKNMKISEDKARMILEAMKSNEVQYLQQNKRRATKPKDKSKPDW